MAEITLTPQTPKQLLAGEEKKQPPKPIPPPVEPPEYYQGYQQELAKTGTTISNLYKQQQKVQGQIQNLSNLSLMLGEPEGKLPPDMDKKIRAGTDAIQVSILNAEWRQEVLLSLPGYLSIPDYNISNPDDIFNYISNPSATDADKAWLATIFEKMRGMTNTIPSDFQGSMAEAQQKLVEQILTPKPLPMKALVNLTVDEMAKYFQPMQGASYPAGMSDEDARRILAYMDIDPEEKKKAQDYLFERGILWRQESARIKLIRDGVINAPDPTLTLSESLKLAAVQPMMAVGLVFEKYNDYITRPLASRAVIFGQHILKPLGLTNNETAGARLEATFNQLRSQGMSANEAYVTAFNQWDANIWLKMGLESVFDPLNYLGWGIATAAATKFGTGLTRVGLKSIGSRIGPMTAAIEGGYMAGSDAVFKGGLGTIGGLRGSRIGGAIGATIGTAVGGVPGGAIGAFIGGGVEGITVPFKSLFWSIATVRGRIVNGVWSPALADFMIPQSLTMMSRNFRQLAYTQFSSVVKRMPKYAEVIAGREGLAGLTSTDITDIVTELVNASKSMAYEGNNPMVVAGTNLHEFNYLNVEEVSDLVKRVVIDLPEIDTPRLTRINEEILNTFTNNNVRQGAGNILTRLGITPTEESVDILAKKLTSFIEKVDKDAVSGFAGSTPYEMVMNGFNRLQSIRYSNLSDPITQHLTQVGRAASWVSRVGDNILYSTNLIKVERIATISMAKLSLLFTSFGPGNSFDNMQRGWLGGAELAYPRAYSGIAETARLVDDLPNYPYWLEISERVEHLSQAAIDPETGKTIVFRGGNIPFINKRVEIAGHQIGFNISMGGENQFIGSFADQYNIFGRISNDQAAYDLQVHYLKALDNLAPDEVAALRQIISEHNPETVAMDWLKKSEVKDIERAIFQASTKNIPSIRAMADIDVTQQQRRLVKKELAKTMSAATEVSSTAKLRIEESILDGTMFTHKQGIKGFFSEVLEGERERNMATLTRQIDILKKQADDFATNPPKNLDEFLSDMETVSSTMSGVEARIHNYRKLTELRKHNLTPGKEMDDFEVGSAKLLANFLKQSEESLDSMIKTLKTNASARLGPTAQGIPTMITRDMESKLKKLGITQDAINAMTPQQAWDRLAKEVVGIMDTTQLSALTDLTNIYQLKTANILSTREKIASIESVISKTSKRSRDDRFWKQITAKKSVVWDASDDTARKINNLQLDASARFLNATGSKVYVPTTLPDIVDGLTPSHISYLFGTTGDDVYRGLTTWDNMVVIRPKDDFIDYVQARARLYSNQFGKTPDDVGFSAQAIGDVYDQLWRNLGIEPSTLSVDSPQALQLNSIMTEAQKLHDTVKVTETDMVKWRKYITGIADDVERLPIYRQPIVGKKAVTDTVTGTTSWQSTKTQAMAKAKEMHALAYPVYGTDDNIIDESMRVIFPFWNYELFRTRWIPRTFMRTPGTLTSLARYMDYTDGGYIPVPFTDLQINPFRGSTWLGGLRSLYNKDYPEYYDKFPGSELMDYVSRAGFYPGFPISLLQATVGAIQGQPDVGGLLPPFASTGLAALRALSPTHIGPIIDTYFPDRFKDFQTMLTLGEQGYDADAIWRKKKDGLKLTPEETKIWLRAEAKANGLKGILMEQTGLFRIRPSEYNNIRKEMRLAIEEATGVSVDIQDKIDKLYPTTGKRFADYYHLDILQQKLLYQSENLRRWQGVTTGLQPASQQMLEVRIQEYYSDVEKLYDAARTTGTYDKQGNQTAPSIEELNRQFVANIISPDQWKSGRSDILSKLAEAVRILGESTPYSDVPKTLEERAQYLADKGILTPTYGPDQELLYYYYDLKPEYKWNPDTGRNEYDFDTYYAHIDILLESLDTEHRQRLVDRIQINWTPLEKLYWQVSREYFRPYNNIRNIILTQYSPEQQTAINRFSSASGIEREDLLALPGLKGENLISGYQRQVREAHLRLRAADPTLDAWANFFGVTSTFISNEAKEIYTNLTSQYKTSSMVK